MGKARSRADGDYKTDNAVVDFGADGDVTLTHDPDDGLILKSKATADDNPVLLTLQTGETDLAANDVIGKISFQAPDEGTGTDAILVSGAIQARAEGDHSSSSNATSLDFMTGASEAAATKMSLRSDGHLKLQGTNSLVFGENNTTSSYQSIGGEVAANNLTYRSYQSHIFKNATGQTSTTDGTEVLKIDANGIVTMPKQPCFRAQRQNASGGTQGFTTNITFNREILDLNADYDTSNGRFTAPVDGTYYFTHGGLGASGSSASVHLSGASWHLEFLKNGARTGFQFYWYAGHPSAGGNQSHYINSYLDLIITLDAGDYITVQLPDGTDSYYSDTSAHSYEAFFQGFLIG